MNKKMFFSLFSFLTVLFLSTQAQASFFEKFYTVSSSGSTAAGVTDGTGGRFGAVKAQ